MIRDPSQEWPCRGKGHDRGDPARRAGDARGWRAACSGIDECSHGKRQRGMGAKGWGDGTEVRTHAHTHTHKHTRIVTDLEGLAGGSGFLEDRGRKPWWPTETMAALQRAWGLQEG